MLQPGATRVGVLHSGALHKPSCCQTCRRKLPITPCSALSRHFKPVREDFISARPSAVKKLKTVASAGAGTSPAGASTNTSNPQVNKKSMRHLSNHCFRHNMEHALFQPNFAIKASCVISGWYCRLQRSFCSQCIKHYWDRRVHTVAVELDYLCVGPHFPSPTNTAAVLGSYSTKVVAIHHQQLLPWLMGPSVQQHLSAVCLWQNC